jgi:hypothetical protein
MNIRQIDRYIRSGELIEMTDVCGTTFCNIIVSRSRRHFETDDGGKYDRTDIVKAIPKGY